MSKRMSELNAQAFSRLTEPWRNQRVGIRPDFVPEMAAWLLIHAKQYERTLSGIQRMDYRTTDPYVLGMRDHIRHALSTLQTLMDALGSGWERCYWNEATSVVSEHLGIVIGEPLPDDQTAVKGITVHSPDEGI